MASRYRGNFLYGTLSGFNTSQITFTGTGFPNSLATGSYLPIVINPGYNGATASGEIVYVTNIAGTTITVSGRGAEGTTAISGGTGTQWVAGPLASDFGISNQINNGDFARPSSAGQILLSASTSGVQWGTSLTGVGITSSTISNSTISNSNSTGGSISSASISSSTISSPTITNGTISSPTITNGTISSPTITNGSISGTYIQSGTISGTSILSPTITNGSISNASISNGSISNASISNGSISYATLSYVGLNNSTISGTTINGNNTITSGNNITIANGASINNNGLIYGGDIHAANIINSNQTNNVIDTSTITNSTISGSSIGPGNSLAYSDITAGSDGQVLTTSGTSVVWASPQVNGWSNNATGSASGVNFTTTVPTPGYSPTVCASTTVSGFTKYLISISAYMGNNSGAAAINPWLGYGTSGSAFIDRKEVFTIQLGSYLSPTVNFIASFANTNSNTLLVLAANNSGTNLQIYGSTISVIGLS